MSKAAQFFLPLFIPILLLALALSPLYYLAWIIILAAICCFGFYVTGIVRSLCLLLGGGPAGVTAGSLSLLLVTAGRW